jgi:hypothetical protein
VLLPQHVAVLAARLAPLCTPDLLSRAYRRQWTPQHPPGFGACYVAAECLYHLLGGKAAGYQPQVGRDAEGGTHWWLTGPGGIIDPTAAQYTARGLEPPYAQGRGCGFLTREPSRRARLLTARLRASLAGEKIFDFT